MVSGFAVGAWLKIIEFVKVIL